MALGLNEYLDSLDDRPDLLWPRPSAAAPMKASPFLDPLPEIRAVTWSVYGTLLRIDQGALLHDHPQEIRMQIALEKTIKEFNLWNSMTRKAGQPWEYLLRQYKDIVVEVGMASTKKKGDIPEIDSCKIWQKIIQRLVKNEYHWDHDFYGSQEDLAAKMAYFFHANLQGVVASEQACETLSRLASSGMRSGLIADAQVFTTAQLLRALRQQAPVSQLSEVFSTSLFILSSRVGLKKPSESLYRQAIAQLKEQGLVPGQVLHVSHRLQDDLAVAKKLGFRTALFAADKNICVVRGADLKNPDWKPDRLVTEMRHVLQILQI